MIEHLMTAADLVARATLFDRIWSQLPDDHVLQGLGSDQTSTQVRAIIDQSDSSSALATRYNVVHDFLGCTTEHQMQILEWLRMSDATLAQLRQSACEADDDLIRSLYQTYTKLIHGLAAASKIQETIKTSYTLARTHRHP